MATSVPGLVEAMASDRYHHGDVRSASTRAALSLLVREGASAITVRRVAREIGVSHTAVGKELGGLEGLLVACAADIYTSLARALRAAPEGQDDALMRFRAVGQAYLRFATDHPAWLGFVAHPTVQSSPDPSLENARVAAFQMLVDEVELAMERAAIRRDEPVRVALYVWSTCQGFASLVAAGNLRWTNADDPGAVLLDQMYLGLRPL